jgi:patatin-like phospholipase/acyl hydrolase
MAMQVYEGVSEMAKTLEDHLFGDGPKRILALDGGGIRGIISLRILERIENIVGEPISDYFDLIGGTSTGAIIAAGLAHGWSVKKISKLYGRLGGSIFRGSVFRLGLLRAKFSAEPLRQALEEAFEDHRLGGPDLKTGLAIVAKRLDTSSPWVLHNNPKGRYFGPRQGSNSVPNSRYLIRDIVRASTAAPSYFEPEKVRVSADIDGAFVDGGVSPHNNPSLQLLLLACLKGYNLRWELGEEKLLIVSVGTGGWEAKHDPEKLLKQSATANALQSLLSMMDDASALNELLLQWLSNSPTARRIDREVGNLEADVFGNRDPWLTYLRYDAPIEPEWLKRYLPEENLTERDVERLRKMDRPDSMKLLAKIGEAAAETVKPEHFPSAFTVRGSESR